MKPRVRIETYTRRVSVPLALAWRLWDKCGLLRIKSEGTQWVARAGDLIINWGCSVSLHQNVVGVKYLNHPNFVRTKQSKLAQYRKFTAAGVPTVEWTSDPNVARAWGDTERVFCRTSDAAFGGHGIVVWGGPAADYDGNDDPPEARVYTKEFKALREYRVHVFPGPDGQPKVIDVTQKRRRNGAERSAVRSWGNGYVFCHDNLTPPPQEALDAAVSAVKALGLDFGGVDILVKDKVKRKTDQRVAVLEVNSAPGIEGTTMDKYEEAINAYALAHVGAQ